MAKTINAYKDRAAQAANMIDLSPSFTSRLTTAWNYLRNGKMPDWFGPGSPLDPNAPNEAKGRMLDYPTGINTIAISPKANEGVPFYKLRMMADTLDIMRLIIEDFKDQLCKLQWRITKRADQGATAKNDYKSDKLEALFVSPDGEHEWDDWLRMSLEDTIVIDALTYYPQKTKDGLTRFEIVDGSTIKRVIGDNGRTPAPDTPAYQQILKGITANDYLRDELIYKRRNPRSWKIYGFSSIEQCIITITMALWRQSSQLQYYTEGSTPDLIMTLPPDWTTDQIAKFKIFWDSILLGNTAERRGTMFVPNGAKPYETKDKVLTDKMEEWIARVLCFSLRISPQPFISTFNRATAEAAKEQSKEDGVGSYMLWIKRLIDRMLAQYLDSADYEFMWQEEDETDPETKAKIHDVKIRNGSMTINESRAMDGLDPIDGGDCALIITPSGAIRLEDAVKGPMLGTSPGTAQPAPGTPDPAGAAPAKPAQNAPSEQKPQPKNTDQKLAKVVPSGPRMVRFAAAVNGVLTKLRTSVMEQLTSALDLQKATASVSDILNALDLSQFEDLSDDMMDAIKAAVNEGWSQGLLTIHAGDSQPMLHADAADYAEDRIGLRLSKTLPDSTRAFIRETVAQAIEDGWDADKLTKALEDNYAFSDIRARTIADTELADAQMRGVFDAWGRMGVLGKSWATSADDNVCTVCVANEYQGVIPLNQPFQSGHQHPTAHPKCHCDLIPHTSLEN